MLRNGDFAVEVTIFEDGVPPEFHVYAYKDDKPLAPSNVQLEVTLGRLGGRPTPSALRRSRTICVAMGSSPNRIHST